VTTSELGKRAELPSAGLVSLKVYDLLGREAAVLVQGYMEKGIHTATWTLAPGASTSGTYYARLVVSDESGNVVFSKTTRLVAVQ